MHLPISEGDDDAETHILLAHGAGAPATSPFLCGISKLLVQRGMRVSRFNFDYMATILETGKRRPPSKIEHLEREFIEVVETTLASTSSKHSRFLIGGKSMGGRVASLIANRLHGTGTVSGLVCLGYPFHPVGKPDRLRVSHLAELKCPALIVQGKRDPFGNADEVAGYVLSPTIQIHWANHGDHDLAPRAASGFTLSENLDLAADAIALFAKSL